MFNLSKILILWFQHTAARRRLQMKIKAILAVKRVSTHSRAEAAANSLINLTR